MSDRITTTGLLTKVEKTETHRHEKKKSQGPGAVLSTLVAVAISAATWGAGTSIAATLEMAGNMALVGGSQALVTGLATQMTLGTLTNEFNPVKAVREIAIKEGITSLGASVVVGALVPGAPGVKATPLQIVEHALTKTLVRGGVDVAFGRQSLDEMVRGAGLNFVTDVVGHIGAQHIGSLYNNGKGSIDFATHKLLHAGLGAGLGALKGDMVARAIGGFVAETVADLVSGDVEEIAARVDERAEREGVQFGSEAYQNLACQEVQMAINWGRLGAAVTVALAGHDVNVGLDVATNAVENNFVHMIILGVIAVNALLTTVDVIEGTYKGGLEGGLHVLREDAAMALATGGGSKPFNQLENFSKGLKIYSKALEKLLGLKK